MTLLLTEVSECGIVMVSDSAISRRLPSGRIKTGRQERWKKLLKAEKIKAGVSYWGSIGEIDNRFNEWIEHRIKNGSYTDLPSLADYLAAEMNSAAQNRPISEPTGIHVAGFHPWADGHARPTFFHVHNGHGVVKLEFVPNGVQPIYEGEPRRLFARHNDFPKHNASLDESLSILAQGYPTRNGDFFPYVLISEGISNACSFLNQIPNVSIPKRNDLGARMRFFKLQMETVISIYACSTMPKWIAGAVQMLAIKSDGYLR